MTAVLSRFRVIVSAVASEVRPVPPETVNVSPAVIVWLEPESAAAVND